MTSHLLSDAEAVEAYRLLQIEFVDLLRTIDPAAGELPVPHCPAWTVAQTCSHLVGVPEDILAGRMEGVTTDAWTDAQVRRHLGESLRELADSSDRTMETFADVLPAIPAPVNSQLVMDAVTHLHDVRHAVGRPGSRDSLAVRVGTGWLLDRAENAQSGLGTRLVGSGVSRFDLLRVLGGRRSLAQMEALGLDSVALAPLFEGAPLRPPHDSIDE